MGGIPTASMVILPAVTWTKRVRTLRPGEWRVGCAAALSVFDKAFDEASDRGSPDKDTVMPFTENIGGERLELA